MTFGVLPVKAPGNAKQRLSTLLSAPEREALARAMFEEVLAALLAARGLDAVAVATCDRQIAGRAQLAGAVVFLENGQRSHSDSADAAARRAMALGATSVVLLPVDVPLVRSSEIEALAAAAPRPGVLIVPSQDGTGTNALVRTPPDAIPSCFGPGSFRLHLDAAQAKGLRAEVARPPGITFDLDTPDDVAELLRRAPDCRIARMLRDKCVSTS